MSLLEATLFSNSAIVVAALVAVILVGLSKGGLSGAGLMGVPVLSLVMPPMQAAALLLPILLMMDAVSLWTWRGWYDRAVLRAVLPAAMLGIGLGWMAAAFTSDAAVRLIVGVVALGFVARVVAQRARTGARAGPGMAWLWGAVSGFTSFVAHAGGPPFQIYALPLRLDPKVYTGTSVILFAAVNAAKLLPYAALGFFDTRTMLSALAMLPPAVVAVMTGAAIVKRMRPAVFYPLMYAMIALVGVKLVYDGLTGLF